MSRIGKLPVVIPEGVLVEINDRNIKIKKDNQELFHQIPSGIKVKIENQRNPLRIRDGY